MSWINKPLARRLMDVNLVEDLIEQENPDRFWYANSQEGNHCQEIEVLLPIGTELFYRIRLMTVQLKALRLLAYESEYDPAVGQIPASLLDRVSIISEEQFDIQEECQSGIGIEAVLDVDALTHSVIEHFLSDLIKSKGSPPQPRPVRPSHIIKRLLDAEQAGQLSAYSLASQSEPISLCEVAEPVI